VDLIIKNAKIYFNNQVIEGGIAIEKGRIVQVAKMPNLPSADFTLDVKGNLVIPGVIDIHAHLRDLKFQKKEDFFTGTCAAANGGITTVVDMPNTNPPTISRKRLIEKRENAKKKIIINVGFYAGIPDTLGEIKGLVEEGVFGFKLYLANAMSQYDIFRDEPLRALLKNLMINDCPLLIHAERRQDIIKGHTSRNIKKNPELEAYLERHAINVEEQAIQYILELNKTIQAKIHICHVSTAPGLEFIKAGKMAKQQITTEVTPHHLFLTIEDLYKYGTFAKMLPPLRTKDQVNILWKGLNDGIIDIIATDHAPHLITEKKCKFSEAANGIPGFETMVSLLFTAFHQGKITLKRLIESLSINPARFLKLDTKGKIAVGYDADLTVIDLKRERKIDSSTFYSKAKFSPFDGRIVKGIPIMTIVTGEIIMKNGNILTPKGSGRILQRTKGKSSL